MKKRKYKLSKTYNYLVFSNISFGYMKKYEKDKVNEKDAIS
jgi:hypothetical protein